MCVRVVCVCVCVRACHMCVCVCVCVCVCSCADTLTKQLQNVTLQSRVMGSLVSRKKVSKWQEFNIDDLMQMMGEGDEAKQWYAIVDKLINMEKPVITPNTKVCKLGHCPIC